MIEYFLAKTKNELAAARHLFGEYAVAINIDLSFQYFEDELANLENMYTLPFGGIILCKKDHEFVGCVAIRKIDENTAELKRMFVKPGYRNLRIAKALLEEALKLATEYNYEKVRLDTLASMITAIHLYKQYGFYEIDPYYYNPIDTAIFFEKML